MADKDDQTPADVNPSERPTRPTTMEIHESPPPEWASGRRAPLSPVMLSPGSTTQKLIASGKIKSCFILLEKTSLDPRYHSPKHFTYEDTGKLVGGDGEEKACKRPTGFREFSKDKLVSLDIKSPKERSDVNRNVFTSMLRGLHTVLMEDVKEQGLVTNRVSPQGNMDTTPILMSDCSESDQMTRTDYEYPSIDSDTIGDTFSVNFDAESVSSTGSSETLEYSESIPDGTEIDGDIDDTTEVEGPTDEPPHLEILDSWTVPRPTFDDPPLLSPPLLTSITENKDMRCSFFTFPKSSQNFTSSSPHQRSRESGKVEESQTFGCQNSDRIPLIGSREPSNDERSSQPSEQQQLLSDNVEKTKSIESLESRTRPCVSNSSRNKDVLTGDSHQFSNDIKWTKNVTEGDRTIEVLVTSKLTPNREDSTPHSNQKHSLNDTQEKLNTSETQEKNNLSKTITSKPSQTSEGVLENLNQHHSLSNEEYKSCKNQDNLQLSIATSQSIGISYQQSPSNENVRDRSSPKDQENENSFVLQLSKNRQVSITTHQSHASQSSEVFQSSKTNITGTDPSAARNEKTSTISMKDIIPLPDLDPPGHSPGHLQGHIHDSSQPCPSMRGRIVDMQTNPLNNLDVARSEDVSALPSSEETIPASPTLVIEGVQSVEVQIMELPGAIGTIPSQQNEHPPTTRSEQSENIVNDVFFASSTFSVDTATNSDANSQETSRNPSVASLGVDEHCEDAEYQQILRQFKEGGKHANEHVSDTGSKDPYAGALHSNDYTETTQGSDHVVLPMLTQEKHNEKGDRRADDVSEMPDNADDVANSRCDNITSQPSFSHEGSQCPEVCGFANEVTVEVCDFESVDSSVSEVNSEIERAVASITDDSISTESKMTGGLDDCFEKLTSDEIRRRLEVTDSSSCASSTVDVTHSTNQVSVDIEKDQTDRDSVENKSSVNDQGDTNEIVDDAKDSTHNKTPHSGEFVKTTSTADSNSVTNVSDTLSNSPSKTVTSVSHTPTVPLTHRQKDAEHKSVQGKADVPNSGVKPCVVSSLTREDDTHGMKTPYGDINQSATVDVGSKTDQNLAQKSNIPDAPSASSDINQFGNDSRLREIDTAISLAIMSEITTLPSRVDPNCKAYQSIASSGAQTQETNIQSSSTSSNIQLTSSVHDHRRQEEMRPIRPAGPTVPGSVNPSRPMFTAHQVNFSPSVATQGSLNHPVAAWPLPRGRGRYKGNFAVVDYSVTENEKPGQFIELRRCLTQERRLHPDLRPPPAPQQPPSNPLDRKLPVSQYDWSTNLRGQGVSIHNGVPIEFPGGKRFIAYNKEAFCYPPQNTLANQPNEQVISQTQQIGAVPVSRVPPQMPQIVPRTVQFPSNTAGSYPQQQQYPRPNLTHQNLSMSRYPMHPNFIHQQRHSNYVNDTDRARKSPGVYTQQGLVVHPTQNASVAGSRHDQSQRVVQPRASTPRIASVSPDVVVVSNTSELQSQAREHSEPMNASSFPRAPQLHEVGLRGQLPGDIDRGLLMATSTTNQGVNHLTLSYQAQQKFRSARGPTDSTDVEAQFTQNKVCTLPPTQVPPLQNPPQDHASSDFEYLKRMATAAATNKMIRSDAPLNHQNQIQKAAPTGTNFGPPPGACQADQPAQAAVTARCDPLSLPASAFIGNLAETSRLRGMNQETYNARKSHFPVHTPNETATTTTETIDNRPQTDEHKQKDTSQIIPQSKDNPTTGQEDGGPIIPTHTPPPSTLERTTRTWTSTEEALLKSLPEDLANYLVNQCRKGGEFRETLKAIIEESLKEEEEETQNDEAVRVWNHTVHHLPNQTPKVDSGHPKDGHLTPNADHPSAPTEAPASRDPKPAAREQYYDTQPQHQAVSLTTSASKSASAPIEFVVDVDDDARQHSEKDQAYGRTPIFFFNPAPSSTPLLEADNVIDVSDASSRGNASQSPSEEAIDLSVKQQPIDLSNKRLIDFEHPVYGGQLAMPFSLSNSHLCHRAYTAGERGPIRASSVVDLTSNSILPPIDSFLQKDLSSTQLMIRNKLLERRSRIQGRSISTPDILHGYAYSAKNKQEKLIESNNVETETTSPVNHPTVQGARRDGTRVFEYEKPVMVITSPHSAKAVVSVGNVHQTIDQLKDAIIDLAMNRKRDLNEPTLEPDTTAKYPKMKSKLQNAWINASGQQSLSSKDSQENRQPSVEARPYEKPTLNLPQPSTVLPNPTKPVTCSKDRHLQDTPAIIKPVLHVDDIPNPSSRILSQKRKRGRPKGSGPVSKRMRPDTSSSDIDLECQFCSFKSCFRSEIRAHVKNDHFAKFCKVATTTRRKKPKRDNINKLVTTKVDTNPVSSGKNANVMPGPPNRNTQIATDKSNTQPSVGIRHSGNAVKGAVTAMVVNVIPGNPMTTASYVAIQNAAITGGIAPMKQAKPQIAVSPSVQQKIQPAYAPHTKTQIDETRAAEAISTASPAATTSTVRPSLNERPTQTPFRCGHCKQYCNSSRELLIHNKFQHTNTKGLHMCFNCGYTAKSEYQLRKHILKWHQNQGVENHKCTRVACGQSFPTQDQLQTHMQMHDAGRNYRYVCNLCDAKYHNLTGLRYHQQRHKLNYPHKCKECGLKFKSLGMLNRHEFQKNHISS